MGIELENLHTEANALETALDQLTDLHTAFTTIGDDIADQARGRIHNVSGRLGQTVRSGVEQNKAYVVAGSSTVAYAGYVNGRRGTRSTGFLTTPANDPTGPTRHIQAALDQIATHHNQETR
jgi:hypothetical protein